MKMILLSFLFMTTNAFAFKVAIISDLNSSYGSTVYNHYVKTTVEKIVSLKPDLILSTGDMVAGQKANLNYLKMWNSFHLNVTQPFQNNGIPFAVTPGNHDGAGSIKFKNERKIFISEWKKNKPNLNFISDEFYPEFYAFEIEKTLFISLDATVPGKLSKKQTSWLENLLSHSHQYKNKIVYGHLPIIPTVKAKVNENIQDNRFEELLKKYNVNMYISGHQHAYYPGTDKNLKHLGMACLGSGPRSLFNMTQRSSRSFVLLDINNSITHSAYNVEKNFSEIKRSELPSKIKIKNRTLYRDDESGETK